MEQSRFQCIELNMQYCYVVNANKTSINKILSDVERALLATE